MSEVAHELATLLVLVLQTHGMVGNIYPHAHKMCVMAWVNMCMDILRDQECGKTDAKDFPGESEGQRSHLVPRACG